MTCMKDMLLGNNKKRTSRINIDISHGNVLFLKRKDQKALVFFSEKTLWVGGLLNRSRTWRITDLPRIPSNKHSRKH